MSAFKDIRHSLNFFPRQHMIVLGALLTLLLVSQLLLQEPVERQRLTLDIPSEKLAPPTPAIETLSATQGWRWKETEVRSGDNLSLIFKRMGVSATVLHYVMQSGSKAEDLQKLKPGQIFRFAFDDNNTLMALQFSPSQLETYEVLRQDGNDYEISHNIRQPEIRLIYKQGAISGSLSIDAQKADIPQGIIMNFANIFGGVIDFIFEPRKGDTFDVLYEEHFLDGKKIGTGNILVASYTNSSETQRAFRYEFEDGRSSYFNEKGISMRKPFLRAPLDVFRISSGFNLRRKHPIHKKIKAHRGTDYAAPTGTPVFAAGDGRVLRSGFSRANGNYVFIKHGEQYITKYLHLHKRYVRTGQRVKQRETIGSVGSTGYSTGPHLHYEFLVNGVHRNPRTILKKLPSALPIPKTEKQRFKEQLAVLEKQYQNFLAVE